MSTVCQPIYAGAVDFKDNFPGMNDSESSFQRQVTTSS